MKTAKSEIVMNGRLWMPDSQTTVHLRSRFKLAVPKPWYCFHLRREETGRPFSHTNPTADLFERNHSYFETDLGYLLCVVS